ncbi:hypothetical protein BLNAU_11941 [Blattamonas nauphoetae]|uniref:EF-hand domain-containing protein n=1 Tax=Blattamonas nauphoetae TaxID=2049346 RepID=A0ABQ9XS24_9EUKA|nr:hypothetical protein BLNAU_11941 [Blattamonas nauphoetae]
MSVVDAPVDFGDNLKQSTPVKSSQFSNRPLLLTSHGIVDIGIDESPSTKSDKNSSSYQRLPSLKTGANSSSSRRKNRTPDDTAMEYVARMILPGADTPDNVFDQFVKDTALEFSSSPQPYVSRADRIAQNASDGAQHRPLQYFYRSANKTRSLRTAESPDNTIITGNSYQREGAHSEMETTSRRKVREQRQQILNEKRANLKTQQDQQSHGATIAPLPSQVRVGSPVKARQLDKDQTLTRGTETVLSLEQEQAEWNRSMFIERTPSSRSETLLLLQQFDADIADIEERKGKAANAERTLLIKQKMHLLDSVSEELIRQMSVEFAPRARLIARLIAEYKQSSDDILPLTEENISLHTKLDSVEAEHAAALAEKDGIIRRIETAAEHEHLSRAADTSLYTLAAQYQALQKTNDRLSTERDEAVKRAFAQSQQAVFYEDENVKLMQRVDQLSKTIVNLRSELESKLRVIIGMEGRIRGVMAAKANLELRALEREDEIAEDIEEEVARKLDEIQKERMETMTDVGLQSDMSHDYLRDLRMHLTTIMHDCVEVEAQTDLTDIPMVTQLVDAKKKQKELERRVTNLSETNQRLTDLSTTLKTELDASELENKQLKNEIRNMKNTEDARKKKEQEKRMEEAKDRMEEERIRAELDAEREKSMQQGVEEILDKKREELNKWKQELEDSKAKLDEEQKKMQEEMERMAEENAKLSAKLEQANADAAEEKAAREHEELLRKEEEEKVKQLTENNSAMEDLMKMKNSANAEMSKLAKEIEEIQQKNANLKNVLASFENEKEELQDDLKEQQEKVLSRVSSKHLLQPVATASSHRLPLPTSSPFSFGDGLSAGAITEREEMVDNSHDPMTSRLSQHSFGQTTSPVASNSVGLITSPVPSSSVGVVTSPVSFQPEPLLADHLYLDSVTPGAVAVTPEVRPFSEPIDVPKTDREMMTDTLVGVAFLSLFDAARRSLDESAVEEPEPSFEAPKKVSPRVPSPIRIESVGITVSTQVSPKLTTHSDTFNRSRNEKLLRSPLPTSVTPRSPLQPSNIPFSDTIRSGSESDTADAEGNYAAARQRSMTVESKLNDTMGSQTLHKVYGRSFDGTPADSNDSSIVVIGYGPAEDIPDWQMDEALKLSPARTKTSVGVNVNFEDGDPPVEKPASGERKRTKHKVDRREIGSRTSSQMQNRPLPVSLRQFSREQSPPQKAPPAPTVEQSGSQTERDVVTVSTQTHGLFDYLIKATILANEKLSTIESSLGVDVDKAEKTQPVTNNATPLPERTPAQDRKLPTERQATPGRLAPLSTPQQELTTPIRADSGEMEYRDEIEKLNTVESKMTAVWDKLNRMERMLSVPQIEIPPLAPRDAEPVSLPNLTSQPFSLSAITQNDVSHVGGFSVISSTLIGTGSLPVQNKAPQKQKQSETKPKQRSLFWIQRLSRMVMDELEATAVTARKTSSIPPTLAEYLTSWVTQQYGVKSLVQQQMSEINDAVSRFQGISDEIAIFSLFLNGTYHTDHINFYTTLKTVTETAMIQYRTVHPLVLSDAPNRVVQSFIPLELALMLTSLLFTFLSEESWNELVVLLKQAANKSTDFLERRNIHTLVESARSFMDAPLSPILPSTVADNNVRSGNVTFDSTAFPSPRDSKLKSSITIPDHTNTLQRRSRAPDPEPPQFVHIQLFYRILLGLFNNSRSLFIQQVDTFFREHDTDDDGYVSFQEAQSLLKTASPTLNFTLFQKLIRRILPSLKSTDLNENHILQIVFDGGFFSQNVLGSFIVSQSPFSVRTFISTLLHPFEPQFHTRRGKLQSQMDTLLQDGSPLYAIFAADQHSSDLSDRHTPFFHRFAYILTLNSLFQQSVSSQFSTIHRSMGRDNRRAPSSLRTEVGFDHLMEDAAMGKVFQQTNKRRRRRNKMKMSVKSITDAIDKGAKEPADGTMDFSEWKSVISGKWTATWSRIEEQVNGSTIPLLKQLDSVMEESGFNGGNVGAIEKQMGVVQQALHNVSSSTTDAASKISDKAEVLGVKFGREYRLLMIKMMETLNSYEENLIDTITKNMEKNDNAPDSLTDEPQALPPPTTPIEAPQPEGENEELSPEIPSALAPTESLDTVTAPHSPTVATDGPAVVFPSPRSARKPVLNQWERQLIQLFNSLNEEMRDLYKVIEGHSSVLSRMVQNTEPIAEDDDFST